MARSTSRLRRLHKPACGGDMVTIDFGHQGARVHVRRYTVPVWRAVEAVMATHHYPIRAQDTGAYACRQITGGSGYSLHAYGIALDVNWQTNPYRGDGTLVTDMPDAMIDDLRALQTSAGQRLLRWGGDYQNVKDAMHFELVATVDELAAGVVTPTTAGDGDMIHLEDEGEHVGQLQHAANRLIYITGGGLDGGGQPHDRDGRHLKIDDYYGPKSQKFVRHAIVRAEKWILDHPIYGGSDPVTALTQAWLVEAIGRKMAGAA